MPLFTINQDKLEAVPETSYAQEAILERKHLQNLLKQHIAALGPDMMVVCDEFSDWEDSSRRIDILCISNEAQLVVVELKRTEDGGHMELQAIRYAAMVSSMTLDQAVNAHSRFLGGDQEKAKSEILEFLDLNTLAEAELSDDVKIILAASNFSDELITSVMWLNKSGLDITCVRLKPYKLDGKILIDATQIVPLPEASNYEIKIREQSREIRKVKTARQEIFKRFWSQLIDRSLGKTQLLANRNASTDHWLSAGIGRTGFSLNISLTEDRSRVECYIRLKEGEQASLAAFKQLYAQREALEGKFGGPLDWQELPGKIGCRICEDTIGGWRSPEAEWPALQDQLIDTLVRMEETLRAPIEQIS
ncbi:DUF4268 domain-containing protein [Bradyrhizobium retamae]|uniref:DUF4268 domain-containing protein n=1 Tax=Bradyrhizobium retamae TaxID=1300035 RepID=A0A0R3MDH1_9BRAD|nr:DUF4268 domain-containing protein [Bradyrhizobium retamae]KRR18328.1 hypothetical protein CQ13_35100 [Bradyrhizobium retamae]